MEIRLPVSGEISGSSRMRERCADTDWRLASKWNGAAVDTRMKSVVAAKTQCARRSRSRIGRSARETPPDCRRFVRQSTHDGNWSPTVGDDGVHLLVTNVVTFTYRHARRDRFGE